MDNTFNSEHWFPEFEKIAISLVKKADLTNVVNSESIKKEMNELKQKYCDLLKVLKTYIFQFGNETEKHLIDKHKVIASYIVLFLGGDIFKRQGSLSAGEHPNMLCGNLDEYFVYYVLSVLITKCNGIQSAVGLLEKLPARKYKVHLLTLFKSYRAHRKTSADRNIKVDVLIFAHLVYFIEKEFLAV